VALSDFCWSIVLIKEHLWAFLQRQGSTHGPVEIYGEMELLHLLDQFFDRGLCYVTEGYEQYAQLHNALTLGRRSALGNPVALGSLQESTCTDR
jgi:hypothetical protein